jgi:anti-anti-sigma factor
MSLGPEAFRVRSAPQECRVSLSGEIDLAVGRELTAAFAQIPHGSVVVVDVSGVTFIDSTGMSKLAEAARSHRVALLGTPPRMRRLMELTGLGDVFALDHDSSPAGLHDGALALPRRDGIDGAARTCRGSLPRIPRREDAAADAAGPPHTADAPVEVPAPRPVTFRCTADASEALLVAEFTDWLTAPVPMARSVEGFEVTVDLEPGRSYRYKYLLDGDRWVNDLAAGTYVENEFGGYDSVCEL